MLTKQRMIAHPKPASRLPSRRSIVAWIFVAVGIGMAFSTAMTTADEGLHVMMVIVGTFLSGGLVFDITRWALRRTLPPSDE